MRDRTIREVFEDQRPSLVPYVGPCDGFHAVPAAVSKICLVRFNRQMVDILSAVLIDGLDAVEAACAEALSHNVRSAGVVLNIPARHREPPASLTAPAPLSVATPNGRLAWSKEQRQDLANGP